MKLTSAVDHVEVQERKIGVPTSKTNPWLRDCVGKSKKNSNRLRVGGGSSFRKNTGPLSGPEKGSNFNAGWRLIQKAPQKMPEKTSKYSKIRASRVHGLSQTPKGCDHFNAGRIGMGCNPRD